MSVNKITQRFETTFWDLVTPIIAEKGPLMKTIHFFRNLILSIPTTKAVLILVWAAIGFVSGLLLGRLMMLLNFV